MVMKTYEKNDKSRDAAMRIDWVDISRGAKYGPVLINWERAGNLDYSFEEYQKFIELQTIEILALQHEISSLTAKLDSDRTAFYLLCHNRDKKYPAWRLGEKYQTEAMTNQGSL